MKIKNLPVIQEDCSVVFQISVARTLQVILNLQQKPKPKFPLLSDAVVKRNRNT